jgi:benzodiazapine receptor
MRSALALALFVAAAFSAAAFGARYTPGEWYAALVKPSFNPPSWVFAPVWTVLYLVMGISGWLVWRRAGFGGAALPLAVFAVQLALNAAWSWIFFGQNRLGLALAEILLLWTAILATTLLFWRVSRTAAILLLPYLAWVAFAAVLNWRLWRLNP